jgi:hypothetical protein
MRSTPLSSRAALMAIGSIDSTGPMTCTQWYLRVRRARR